MNENKIEVFSSTEFGAVRTVETEDGKILFCGADVAKALGYTNASKAIKDHCRYVTKRYTPHPQSADKQIEMAFIPESDLYRLITHSKLPTAEHFESWVFDEVLPTIRRHGAYTTNTPDYSTLSPQLQLLIQMEQRQNELEQRQMALEKKLEFDREETIKATFEFGRIGALQREEITRAVKKRAIEICRYAETYDKIGKSVISSIYKALQRHFDVPSYLDLAYRQYTDAMIFIQCFEPNQELYIKILKEYPKSDMSLLSALTEPHEGG